MDKKLLIYSIRVIWKLFEEKWNLDIEGYPESLQVSMPRKSASTAAPFQQWKEETGTVKNPHGGRST